MHICISIQQNVFWWLQIFFAIGIQKKICVFRFDLNSPFIIGIILVVTFIEYNIVFKQIDCFLLFIQL